MDYIEIKGYKSIRDARIEIRDINILIGANGSGKSNFISFFEFLNALYNQRLQEYVALNGGVDKMLHHGSKVTNELSSYISFQNNLNGYSFNLKHGNDSFIFTDERAYFKGDGWDISEFKKEAKIKNSGIYRAKYVRGYLNSLRRYHFHDTGKNSPFNQTSNIYNDKYILYEKGSNLSTFLYGIREEEPIVYNRIIKQIQSIAPYFSDFWFNERDELIRLNWQDKYSNTIYGANDLSDGTIRFIALTTLLLQPNLPDVIVIDEPELGLHPFAIGKLSGMIQSAASRGTKVIVATQSPDLVSYFNPEDIITVDQIDGETNFNRLENDEFERWLNDFSMGDLWKKNIFEGGQPN